MVTKLDRLGRSTLDLLRIIDLIRKEGVASDRSLILGRTAGRLMVTVLSGIAEFERDLILQRTAEGQARAMAEVKRFGRRPKLTTHQAREALRRAEASEPLRENLGRERRKNWAEEVLDAELRSAAGQASNQAGVEYRRWLNSKAQSVRRCQPCDETKRRELHSPKDDTSQHLGTQSRSRDSARRLNRSCCNAGLAGQTSS